MRSNNNNPHMTPGPGIEPGPHWWEASALIPPPLRSPGGKRDFSRGTKYAVCVYSLPSPSEHFFEFVGPFGSCDCLVKFGQRALTNQSKALCSLSIRFKPEALGIGFTSLSRPAKNFLLQF